jgi:hypothetical protein
MRPKNRLLPPAVALALLVAVPGAASAETDKARVVNTICRALQECYVFESAANEAAELYRAQLAAGAYDGLEGPLFATKLHEDGQSVLNDAHFSVRYNPNLEDEYVKPVEDEDGPGFIPPHEDMQRWIDTRRAENTASNAGFEELRILEGGIGYLKLNEFQRPLFAAHIYSAAISFLQDSNAIIIDLRSNSGGASPGLQLLASYFFPSGDYHLNNYETRALNKFEQTWTLPAVDGPRLPYTPVYILTSRNTFSAAESFTYSMQALGRATVIGDRTGGGAHRVTGMPINQGFLIMCPYSRNVNPITGTNWEGTGVQPDIKVASEQALTKAHAIALQEAAERLKDDPIRSPGLAWAAPIVRAKADPVEVPENILKQYVGTYGPRTISFENGHLMYARGDRPARQLIPLAESTFMIEDSSRFKMTFERDEAGKVTAIHGQYQDGHEDHSPRDDG